MLWFFSHGVVLLCSTSFVFIIWLTTCACIVSVSALAVFMRTSVNPDANFHCTCMLSSYLNDHGVGKAPSTADLSQGDESTFRLNFCVSSHTSVIIFFKSSPNMVSYHPTIADQLSVFFFAFPPAIFICYICVVRLSWCPRCFFKNDRQNYLKKLFARCGSVVII